MTGGAVRLGRAMVETLAEAGWVVAFTYRTSAEQARALEAKLMASGGSALGLEADGTAGADRERLVAAVVERFGALDALVNNAGIFPRTPFDGLTEEQLDSVLRTGLQAPILLAQACAPHLRARSGSIVNIADIYGLFPLRSYLAYAVAKAGLIAATKALALELAPEVRVNAIAPGIALFPDDYPAEKRQRLTARTPLGRAGSPGEIAAAVRYLLEGTQTMTGQVLVIDAGRTVAL